MTHCTQDSFDFPPVKRRRVQANFEGGAITSDGDVLLLRQVDQRLGLSEAVARALNDPRRQASCLHDGVSLLRQRLYGLALGYDDLNDHQPLRHDVALQTAVERESVLASSATLCRWENRAIIAHDLSTGKVRVSHARRRGRGAPRPNVRLRNISGNNQAASVSGLGSASRLGSASSGSRTIPATTP